MKVEIVRLRKGVFIPRAKALLADVSYLSRDESDAIIDDIVLNDKRQILMLRGPITKTVWTEFTKMFEAYQLPTGPAGSASHFVEPDDDEWDNEDLSDSDETDEASMQLFCIKTEGRKNNYEILVLATDEEVALEHAIQDRACVKEIKVVPGPFSNGTVLSTKLIPR